jgi:hypothetical protein
MPTVTPMLTGGSRFFAATQGRSAIRKAMPSAAWPHSPVLMMSNLAFQPSLASGTNRSDAGPAAGGSSFVQQLPMVVCPMISMDPSAFWGLRMDGLSGMAFARQPVQAQQSVDSQSEPLPAAPVALRAHRGCKNGTCR